MTGRDLIIYILSNNLEDKDIFEDGKLIGFITVGEAAERMNVGVATVYVWIRQKRILGLFIGDEVYIPANFQVLSERGKDDE